MKVYLSVYWLVSVSAMVIVSAKRQDATVVPRSIRSIFAPIFLEIGRNDDQGLSVAVGVSVNVGMDVRVGVCVADAVFVDVLVDVGVIVSVDVVVAVGVGSSCTITSTGVVRQAEPSPN